MTDTPALGKVPAMSPPSGPSSPAAPSSPVVSTGLSAPRDSLDPGPTRRGLVARLSGSSRFVKFALVGVSGVFVNLGMLYLFADRLDWPELVASASAIEVSILWNFLLNNAFTFRDRNAGAHAGFLERLARYNLVALVGLGLQLGAFALLTQAIMSRLELSDPGLYRYPAQLAGIVLGMGWNFLTNFFWTWRQRGGRDE